MVVSTPLLAMLFTVLVPGALMQQVYPPDDLLPRSWNLA